MAKLKVDIGGGNYFFELDRASIRWGEGIGFSMEDFKAKPLTQTQLMWAMGLHKHHPTLQVEKLFKLFDQYASENGDFEEVYEFIVNQYQTFLLATLEDSEKPKKKAEIVD
jgi:hypothetical protein